MSKNSQTKSKAYWKERDPYADQSHKKCARCGQQNHRAIFNRSLSRPDGLSAYCRPCEKLMRGAELAIKREHWKIHDPHLSPELKCCTGCKKDLPRSMFTLMRHHVDGLSSVCRECASKRSAANEKREPRARMLRCARARAKKKGFQFAITIDDIVIPTHCPVLGIPLFPGKGTFTDNSPSLDRINNDLGYISGNVRVISYRANSLKSDGTLTEMKLIIEDLRLTQTIHLPLNIN